MPNPMVIRSGECKKFSPNIFNKTKCTNCFKQKEEHSAEALESNRATRKVAKCGYLFVAPGWDFTNPINRTKRWQRRWFVLYDDGELSYSLDEHPETVPQACIDMNKVVDVAEAEELTGNPYSLAITTHDEVHFVKATSREETKWWMDVLSVFPRSKGRHKRNATFPVSKSVTNVAVATNGSLMQPTVTSTRSAYIDVPTNRETVCSDDKNRSRRTQSREKRNLSAGHSYSEDLTKILPTWHEKKTDLSRRLILEEFDAECKLKDVTDSLSRPQSRHSTSSFSSSNLESLKDIDMSTHKQVRGDPDGCGLDLSTLRYSPSSELRIEQVSEDLLNIKKGWLMKQGSSPDQEWNKYWFVLRGVALLYYRDPAAEDQGILDGVIDLSVMSTITEVQVARNYGFQIKTWDERQYTLSAVTAGIRGNWISAIKRAAGMQDDNKMDTDKELPPTPRSLLLSSDEEYRTASENGRQSSSDWGETLPPSPPLNRTPISRVKERARGVTRTRLYNSRNSKSSPPSSRRSSTESTSVRHQSILSSCTDIKNVHEKSEKSSLMKKLEKQAIELEEVKRQLTSALRQLSSAEEELLRLRQRQQDVTALEKQMEDTMQLLQRAEETLKQRNCELSDYMEEKSNWQKEIRATECELHETEERYTELCCELASSREHVEQLRNELASVSERLARGIEENESLYRRLRELEGRGTALSSIRETKGRSLDSLSDLTNIDFDMDFAQYDKDRIAEEYEELRARFEKAVHEIRAMKKELRESHVQNDCLEISLINVRQDLKCKQQSYESQASLMAARIQDLTNKLSSAEKQVRMLKQKLSKSENREKRRSLSLKGRESFAICKELEEKLLLLEKRIALLDQENAEHFKLAEMASKVDPVTTSPSSVKPTKEAQSRIRRKSLDSATSSEPMKILIRMNSLEAKVAEASRKIVIRPSSSSENLESTPELEEPPCSGDGSHDASLENSNIANEIKTIENLLKKKLCEIYAKQKSLQESGTLTEEAKLNIMAEKLAYESILVCRLQEIAAGYNDTDIADAERLMLELDKKLKGEQLVTKSPLDYFTKSLSQYLNQTGKQVEPYVNAKKSVKRKESTAVKMLQKKSNALTKKVDKFMDDRIEELSNVFVNDTRKDFVINDDYVGNIIEMAREAINKKLIQVEISQIMSHCIDNYAPSVTSSGDKDPSFECLMVNRANLEQWSELVYSSLKEQVDAAIVKLKQKYESKLLSSKLENSIFPVSVTPENLKQSLQQFIDILAHKCLLDARLQIIKEKDSIRANDCEITKLDEATIMSEMQYLYTKIQCDLKSNGEKRIFDSLESVDAEVSVLRNSVEDLVRKRTLSDSVWDSTERIRMEDTSTCESNSSQSSWLEGVCRRCFEIKEQIINLQTCLMQSQECQKCLFLQDQLKRKELEFEEGKQKLENQHMQELELLKTDFENERNSLITKHEEEANVLKEKAKKLERRLGALDSEYSQQIDCIRSSYQRTPSPEYDKDNSYSEDSVRQRYQSEIEQLRALCEKGLVAMDNSHKRTITDLEEKHRQEIEALRLEKEQALAEETQATLAALDAMRKAHEAEVQKEIAKFKSEYLRKVQSNQDIGALHKEHEAEMEEIKQEILSLSEKYSIKCVESAALEEELRAANNQLAQAQHHIMQLDNRNKQLRAHLISETNGSIQDEELLQQLEERTKQIANLKEQLTAHDDTLNTICKHLNNGDLDYPTLNSLLEKLQLKKRIHRGIDSNSQNMSIEEKEVNYVKNKIFFESGIMNAELKRYSKAMRRTPQRSPSPCSVSGMVAERKKIFEP
ncbi:protein outspread isoform X2 [Planococcus citri]|uniref:protein outspread isoform X2 n=1 Tax=Planococcus citri TaxID=170843 RepID=UPI0031F8A97B